MDLIHDAGSRTVINILGLGTIMLNIFAAAF
jgi:hypothetical protein